MSAITNLDPTPYVVDGELPNRTNSPKHGDVYFPRREFDVRNNPILEAFAVLKPHITESDAVFAERFLGYLDLYAEDVSVPERQYAEEVLERIAVSGNQKES